MKVSLTSRSHNFQHQTTISNSLFQDTSTIIMDNLKHAALLNNSAIDLLRSGESAAAFNHFRSAIQTVATATASCNDESTNEATDTLLLPRYHKVDLPSSPNSALNHVYEFSAELGDITNAQAPTVYWVVLIFNCATCLHRNGSDSSLHKAFNLYLQCLGLLEPLFSNLDCCDEMLASVLRNQADLFYRLNDFYSVRCTMDKLFLIQQRHRIMKTTTIIAPEA